MSWDGPQTSNRGHLPEADRTIVREVLVFLEDGRALFVAAIWEQPQHVVQSVQHMRTELTNALKRLGEKSPAAAACRSMRGANKSRYWRTSTKWTSTSTLRRPCRPVRDGMA